MLTNITQIHGGKQFQADIEALKLSYQAAKVITDINKPDGITPYNVNELLASLKNVVDTQLSGAGSVDARITALQDDLQGKLDIVNAKSIRDVVRVTGTINGGAATFVQNIATAVPGIDTSKPYGVYYAATNKPIMALDGTQLKYDFATSALIGTPAIPDPLDANPADGVTYIAATGDIDFKVFPVGTFTFANLPADALLDNEELAAVAYDQAIDKIIVDLAQDQTLIDAIKALVGTETVQNQIKLITDALAARLAAVESEVTTLVGDETVDGSVKKQIKTAVDAEVAARTAADTALQTALDAEVTRAKAAEAAATAAVAQEVTDRQTAVSAETSRAQGVEATLQQNIDNEVTARTTLTTTVETNRKAAVNAEADLAHDIAVINATTDLKFNTTATVNQQVTFVLPEVPNADAGSVVINAMEYFETAHFTVDRPTKTVTWIYTDANGGFDIMAGFDVRFRFHKTAEVAPVVHI